MQVPILSLKSAWHFCLHGENVKTFELPASCNTLANVQRPLPDRLDRLPCGLCANDVCFHMQNGVINTQLCNQYNLLRSGNKKSVMRGTATGPNPDTRCFCGVVQVLFQNVAVMWHGPATRTPAAAPSCCPPPWPPAWACARVQPCKQRSRRTYPLLMWW